MKKFIPYILIVAMIGTFLALSFSGPFSAPKQTEAGLTEVGGAIVQYGGDLFDFYVKGGWFKSIGGAALWGAEEVFKLTFSNLIAWIADLMFKLSSAIFNLASIMMDKAVDFSIRDFNTNIDKIGIIEQGYKMVLNLTNMIFIFILLYVAIGVILQFNASNVKKLLTHIIVAALLINFSLFMTKVIIDASNIFAMGFYNGIQTEVRDDETGKILSVGSISAAMMNGLRISSIFQSKDSIITKVDESKGLNHLTITMVQFGGSALLLVTSFVYFAVAILFIMRFVTLLFYMIFSPVAFLGYVFPELEEYSKKWWKGLQNQALFAPVFMFMIYLIASMISSGKLWEISGGDFSGNATLFDAFGSSFMVAYPVMINYGILIAMMIGALITSKTMAKTGSDVGFKYAEKVRSWAQGTAGRNTLGRGAYLAGNNRYMAKFMAKSPTVGNFVKTQFDNVAGRKFGKESGASYTEALNKSTGKKKKMGDFVNKYIAKGIDNETQKQEDLIGKKTVSIIKQEKKVEKVKADYERLRNKASETKNKADIDIADLTAETLQREEAMLEDLNYQIKKSNEKIAELKPKKELIQKRAKKIYAKNLRFAHWGLGPLDKIFPSGADAAAEIRKSEGGTKEQVTKMVDKLVEERIKEKGGGAPKEKGEGEAKE